MDLLLGKSHGIILDTKQTWYQITDIGYKQQDPTVRFPVADVLNEKNARKVTRRVVLKGDKKSILLTMGCQDKQN